MTMPRQYILKDGIPVQEPDLIKWATWFETSERIIATTQVGKELVSTVFLGLDHNYTSEGPPILWETMVFGNGKHRGHTSRCAGSKEQAEAMHNEMVRFVMEEIP